MLKNITALFKKHPATIELLQADEFGVRFYKNNDLVDEFAWQDVDEAIVYKEDMVTSDLVKCEFYCRKDNLVHAFYEDIVGFWDMMKIFKRSVPTSAQDWEEKVINPPYEQNLTLIYRKNKEFKYWQQI